MNHVTMTCPHCGHSETDDAQYSAAAIPISRGRFRRTLADGTVEELMGESQVTCDHCGGDFLYRLVTRVACETAAISEFQEKHPKAVEPTFECGSCGRVYNDGDPECYADDCPANGAEKFTGEGHENDDPSVYAA